MCVSLLVSCNYFLKVVQSDKAKPARKQNLTRNSHSKSFKVIHFGISEKQNCISLYNNTGLISEVSKGISRKKAENCRCRQPHCRLAPPYQETSVNICINLLSPEIRIIGLHFCHWFSLWVPKDVSFLQMSVYRPFKVIQGRWFWHQLKGRTVCDFLLVIIGHILHRFWDMASCWRKIIFLPHSHLTPSLGVHLLEFLAQLFCQDKSLSYPLVKISWL